MEEMLERAPAPAGVVGAGAEEAEAEEMVVVVEEEADLLGPAVRRRPVAEAIGEVVDVVVRRRKLQALAMVCSADL